MQNIAQIPQRLRLRRLPWRWLLPFAGLLHACAGHPPVQTPLPAPPPPPLPAGPPLLAAGEAVERSLPAGSAEPYRLAADPGWLVALEVEARAPLAVRVLAPSGAELARAEARTGWSAPLRLTLLTPEGGEQRIELAAPSSAGGEVPYRLAVLELRPPRPGDGERVAAEAALAAGERLAHPEEEPGLQAALESAARARQLFESAGDGEGRDRALLALAELRLRLGSPVEAGGLARQALAGAGERGDCGLQARALTLLGASALPAGEAGKAADAGEAGAARDSLERALPLWRGLERPSAPAALAGRGRALSALGRLTAPSEPERGYALLRDSLAPLREAGDTEGEALARAALQPLLAARGAFEEGARSLDQALTLSRAGGLRAVEARTLLQRAPLRRQAGDLAGAAADYRRAADLGRRLGLPRAALDATFGLCAALRDRDEDDEARLCWTEGVGASQQGGDRERETLALAELAEVALRQGRPKDALALLDRTVSPLRTLAEARRHDLDARLRRDSGIAKRNAGRPRDGLIDLQATLDLLGPAADEAARAQTLIQIGLTRQLLGDLEGAAGAFSAAGELAAGEGREAERRWSRFGVASVAFARKDLEGAWTALEAALALDAGTAPLQAWERTLEPGESGRHPFFELAVELLMRRHFREPGAGFAERAFAASLEARGVPRAGTPKALAELRQGLGGSQALLHYFVGAERSYLFVVTRDGLRPFEVPIRARELAARVQRLRAALSGPQPTPRALLLEAVPLAEVLLRPAEGSLRDFGHWIVSAEGPLLTLPFEVLPADAKQCRGRGFADLPYLLRERTISYRPLPGPLAPPAVPPAASPGKTFAAFAAPLPRGSAPPSPRHREEVEEIAGRYPREAVAVILGSEATERRALTDPEVASARRLHFAAQALFDSNRPARSGVALSPAGEDDDGLLDSAEAARLHLAADLVALPLCRTVRGREVGGEGGYALAGAFLRAGARQVLLDLWPLPEAAASNLLPKLYELLDAGEPPAEALRAAKLSLLQSGAADPVFWAPFVLLDGPAPSPPDPPSPGPPP